MTIRNRHSRGVTLIELVIVALIISILAAIALPSYRKYVLRSHRTEATRSLQDLAGREENYYFSNNAYTSTLSQLASSSSVAGSNYTVNIPSASSTNYTISATAIGTQTQDTDCQSFQLQHDGSQLSNNTTLDTPNCWGK
ncbi:type IV pilin protein [Dyella sp. Tek66A03]|uniref:type IV pilin protein n=1 Tax=Dyella sp. Tek66A03 TaxID=3458298 RepID=UPI00403E715B